MRHRNPLPSERHGHPFDACRSSIGQRTSFRTRLPALAVTTTGTIRHQSRLPKGFGGGRSTSQGHYDRADRSASLPAPVGGRFACANTRGKSARLRGESSRNSYPAHYRLAFASSLVLYPLPYQVVLRLPLRSTDRRTTGLPRSAGETPGSVRSRLSAGGASSASAEFGAADPDHVPFWSKPNSEAAPRRARHGRSSAASLACPG